MLSRNMLIGFVAGFITAISVLYCIQLNYTAPRVLVIPEINFKINNLPAAKKAQLFETLYLSLKKECDIPEKSLNQWRHTSFVYLYADTNDVQQVYEEIRDKCKRGTF